MRSFVKTNIKINLLVSGKYFCCHQQLLNDTKSNMHQTLERPMTQKTYKSCSLNITRLVCD